MTALTANRKKAELAALLNLTGPMTQVVLVVFCATQAILMVASVGAVARPWMSGVALLLVIATAILITRPGPYPLRPSHTVITFGTVVVSTALVSWQLSPHGWPGYASWHLGANTLILLTVGIRGRNGWAWMGMLAMSTVTVLWTTTTGQGILAGVNLVDRQAGTLLMGTLFSLGLARTARAIREFNATQTRRAVQQATAEAANEEREAQVVLLKRKAVPALELLARSAPLTAQQREDLLILEATLRDGVRAQALAQEPLVTSAQRARRRGVRVLLLGDSGSQHSTQSEDQMVRWVASQLDALHEGSFTARVLPSGRTAIASIVVEGASGTRMLEFSGAP